MSGAAIAAMFASRAADVVSLTAAANVSDNGAGSNAEADFSIDNTGAIIGYAANGGGSSEQGKWCVPSSSAPNYYVRCTVTSGTMSAGATTGVWLSTATTRTWIKTRTVAGTAAVTFTIEIATDAAGTNIIATKAGLSLSATK